MCATRIPTQQHSKESGQITTLVFCPFCHGSLSPPNSICHVVLRSHRQTGVHRGAVHWCAPCAVRTSDEGKIEKLAVITIISRDGGRYTYFLMDIEDKLGTKTFRIAYRQYAMPEGVKSRDVTPGTLAKTEIIKFWGISSNGFHIKKIFGTQDKLKKIKSWEPFWSYHLNSTADYANLARFCGRWAG